MSPLPTNVLRMVLGNDVDAFMLAESLELRNLPTIFVTSKAFFGLWGKRTATMFLAEPISMETWDTLYAWMNASFDAHVVEYVSFRGIALNPAHSSMVRIECEMRRRRRWRRRR